MRKMDYQNVRGTQDYLPASETLRRDVKRVLEDLFIKYGYKPLETPILNYTELLASKYGGGAEILEEMYTLSDRGERDLALRYDLTIPFAKVVAMNRSLTLPFKRYEIGKVFRDGPVKTGRLREFTQCDVDIAGVDSQIAEAELMVMALDAFKKLDLKVTIQYNNRKLLTGMLEVLGVENKKINNIVLILDKLEKVSLQDITADLNEAGLSPSTIRSINQFLTDENNNRLAYFESYSEQNLQVKQGLDELKEFESYLNFLGVNKNCIFNPFLARGLDIYTGTIYEIFLEDQSIKSSIGSGGRYDSAIGGLIGTGENISTVGLSFGLDVIYTALRSAKTKEKSDTDYYIIPIATQKEALLVASDLRQQGYNVELDMSNQRVGMILRKANKEKIPKVIIIGENEVNNNEYMIKDMLTGDEKAIPFQFS